MTNRSWSANRRGDPSITRESVVALLNSLSDYFQSVLAETRSFVDAFDFPAVSRRDDPGAHERFFSEHMSNVLLRLYGHPLDRVVADLTAVVFEREIALL